jgi:hypothetical protein
MSFLTGKVNQWACMAVGRKSPLAPSAGTGRKLAWVVVDVRYVAFAARRRKAQAGFCALRVHHANYGSFPARPTVAGVSR